MKLLTPLFNPLQRAATAFFKHHLALRRTDGSVHIVLEQRAVRTGEPRPEELAKRKADEELALMQRQLGELLAGLPEARSAMRHLVFVEQALAKKGLKALRKLPLDVLQHALTQLEGLVINWSPEGLANLRSKMAVAIIDRERMDPEAEADAYRTATMLDSTPAPGPDQGLPDSTLSSADDEALSAAYAALGSLVPTGTDNEGGPELSGELLSPSAKAALRGLARADGRTGEAPGPLSLRESQL